MRSVVAGWTPAASARLTHLMWSLDPAMIDGTAWAVTTTMPAWTLPDRVTPVPYGPTMTPVELHAVLRALIEQLRRAGAVAWLWIIETTARRTPHVHWTVWMPSTAQERDVRLLIVRGWADLLLARHGIEVSGRAQYVRRIESTGWLDYVSKHGARSVKQYQREAIPRGWEAGTGRMWGYGPRQTVQAAIVAPIEGAPQSLAAFHRLRRLWRSWAIADARAQPLIYRVGGRVQHVSAEAVRAMRVSQRGALDDALREHDRRVRACRRSLRCTDRSISTVRGGSWGAPRSVSLRLLEAL